MLLHYLGTYGHAFTRGDGAIGPYFQYKLVVIRHLTYSSVLHREIHLSYRRIDGISRDDRNRCVLVFVHLRRNISSSPGQIDLHYECSIFLESRYMKILVEYLHIRVSQDVSRSDLLRPYSIYQHSLGIFSVELYRQFFEIQYDLGNVLFDARNGRKLVKDTVDLNGSNGNTWQ